MIKMYQEFVHFKEEIIEECKSCNVCLKNCYAYQKTGFKIMKYLPEFYKNQGHAQEIKDFLDSCLYCKIHEHACINSIDLSLLLPSIKSDLSKIYPKYAWKPQNIFRFLTKFLRSEHFYRFWRNFNYKLIPQEFREEFSEYRKPQKREVVFFSGCGIQMLENQYFVLCKIFKKLDLDFGLIDGSYTKAVCCGAVHCEVGNFKNGTYMLKNLVEEVKKFGTKKVIVYCATCYYGLKILAPELIEDYDLEIIHATKYLGEVLTQEMFKFPDGQKRVYTIHDSCHLAHGPKGDSTSIRNLISKLPNSEIVEMRHNRENSLCDLYYVLMSMRNPLTFLIKKDKIRIVDEAIETNADILCTLCPGCHAILSIFGSSIWSLIGKKSPRIPVKNWVSIIGESLGIVEEDMLTYRFKHIISIPIRDSGLWYIFQAFKAILRGTLSKKEPKPIQKKLNLIRKKKKRLK